MKHNFRKLKVWQKSMDLARNILLLTKVFPKHEIYGLMSQINRSVVSIPSNIAEGSSRKSDKDFKRFIDIAIGSCYELETQIELAFSMDYIEESVYQKLIKEIVELEKMLNSFQNKLN